MTQTPDPGGSAPAAQLRALLVDGLATAERLEALLLEERQSLEAEDMAELETFASAKHDELAQLESLERQRLALLSTEAVQPDHEGMDAIAARAGDGAALTQAWQDYLAAALRCQRANQTNGAIIRLRQQQIASVLTALSGERPATYGPAGQRRHASTRALAEA